MDTNARLDNLEQSVGALSTEVAILRANMVSAADLERVVSPMQSDVAVIKATYVTKEELARLEAKMFRWFVTFALAQLSANAAITAAIFKFL